MNLYEIRNRTAYTANVKPTVKEATRTWLKTFAKDYPLALTLTLKQTIVEETPIGTFRRAINRQDCERITFRFQQKLNRSVFGKHHAERHGMSLKFIPVVEGERSGKNLHLHFAIGGLPDYVRLNQFDSLVSDAKKYVQNIDEQHKVDVADSGWIEYITKETATKHSDNVLWSLVK